MRVPLPGGRSIEAVWFSPLVPAATPARARSGAAPSGGLAEGEPAELHRCPCCSSDLVYPVRWEERVQEHWRLELRCPNCEWRRRGEFAPAELERLDEAICDGEELLLESLRVLVRANLDGDLRAIIAALRGEDPQPFL